MKTKKRLLSILLSLVMVLGLVLAMSVTANAVSAYLWIGGQAVSPAGSSNGVGWSYVSSTNTLTLDGYTYNGASEGIQYTGDDELKIVLTGTNTITTTGNFTRGIVLTKGELKFSGTGSLSVKDSNAFGAIQTTNNITIESGTVTAEGSMTGIRTESGNLTVNGGAVTASGLVSILANNITIGGGTVNAEGTGEGSISASHDIKITGGTVEATGTGQNSFGIGTSNGSITISGGEVTAVGEDPAIYGIVRNAIAGTGWTDTKGTQGKAKIQIVSNGQELPNYKRVQFPEVKDSAKVTTPPTAKKLTYSGSAKALVTAGIAEGGTMQYALGTATEATQPYTTSIPTATDAGTYYVWYKAKGDSNHTDSDAKCVKVTISKTDPKPTKVSGTLMASVKAKGVSSLKYTWTKVKGAAGYDIFFSKCNKKNKKRSCKKVKTIKKNNIVTWTKKGLKKGESYKAYIKAYVMKDGKKKYVSNSPYAHAYAGNGNKKFTNAKSVKVKKAKVTLKKGKTFKIKAKVTKVKKSKKLMPKKHVATVRYLSTDKKIATVSSKGKIKAKAKGKCYIYAYAHNGVSRSIKVTVK